MVLEVYWIGFSERELENSFDYYTKKAGYNIAMTTTGGIYKQALKLEYQTEIQASQIPIIIELPFKSPPLLGPK